MSISSINPRLFAEGHISLQEVLSKINFSTDNNCSVFISASIDAYISIKKAETSRENNGFVSNIIGAIEAIFAKINQDDKRILIEIILSSDDSPLINELALTYHKHVNASFFIPILHGLSKSNSDFFILILKDMKKADITIPPKVMNSVTSTIAKKGKYSLLKQVVDIFPTAGVNNQAFRYACQNNDIQMITFLKDKGNDFSALNCNDWLFILSNNMKEILIAFPEAIEFITKDSAIKTVSMMKGELISIENDLETEHILKIIVNKLPDYLETLVIEEICKEKHCDKLLSIPLNDQLHDLLQLPNYYIQFVFYSYLKSKNKLSHKELFLVKPSLEFFTLILSFCERELIIGDSADSVRFELPITPTDLLDFTGNLDELENIQEIKQLAMNYLSRNN